MKVTSAQVGAVYVLVTISTGGGKHTGSVLEAEVSLSTSTRPHKVSICLTAAELTAGYSQNSAVCTRLKGKACLGDAVRWR